MNRTDSTAPGKFRRDVRPPITPDSAPPPGAVGGHQRHQLMLRRTVWPRRVVAPQVWPNTQAGYVVTSRYVRTFWTAALGPGAVADLLRLAAAAGRGRSLRRPPSLSQLCEAGLAREHNGRLEVRTVVPALSRSQLRSLHPAVRRLHAEPRWAVDGETAPPPAA